MKIDVHYAKGTLEGDLEELDMHAIYSKKEDRDPIDFEVRDDRSVFCAEVFGTKPYDDIQIVCEHPVVEFDDDETVGECALCGATCTWHNEVVSDGDCIIKDHVVDEWDDHTAYKENNSVLGRYFKRMLENR